MRPRPLCRRTATAAAARRTARHLRARARGPRRPEG
nr:MAG TPA: hypothetical protein [Caudoviricetes sp.]